jgi:hypothetical protein
MFAILLTISYTAKWAKNKTENTILEIGLSLKVYN